MIICPFRGGSIKVHDTKHAHRAAIVSIVYSWRPLTNLITLKKSSRVTRVLVAMYPEDEMKGLVKEGGGSDYIPSAAEDVIEL